MKYKIIPIVLLICTQFASAKIDYTKKVNIFLGTNSSAQCSPAAIRPFGMISPGPFNSKTSPCGYQSRFENLIGFNHTHLQGTGCGSYGILVLLPTIGNKELGTTVKSPITNQSATPGYYKTILNNENNLNITAEMTCTKRAAIHRYTFPQSESSQVLIDLAQGILYTGKGEISGKIKHGNNNSLSGYVHTTAWGEHSTWFYMEFNKPFEFKNKKEKGGITYFKTKENEEIYVKVGISYVSAENAKLNLHTEIPEWNFNQIKEDAKNEWNKELSKFEVKGGNHNQNVNFYTAIYHSMFHPQLTSDVNNQYRGLDGEIHTTKGHNHYSVLSTWDTFRAAHPLYTLVAPKLQSDVINTMLDDFNDSGWGPRWKLGSKEVFCMPGSWSDVIISDAFIKGITDFDTQTAWDLVYKNATVHYDKENNSRGRRDNLQDYLKYGYVNYPKYINVSKTLEHAYCDFNISQFAKALNKENYTYEFKERALNYKKLWDSETKFFRGKDKNGNWSYTQNFDPCIYTGKGNNDYCEGNAWQWNWHVMQDTQGLINLMGGDKEFEHKLDTFFKPKKHKKKGHNPSSHIFGEYWHGNEPDQHAIYAYNYIGKPEKTAEKIRLVLENEYKNNHWGISGNEDAGQMSAWYIFSAMGFYPYLHSVPQYTIGSPIFDEVILNLPNGSKCKITTENNSDKNIYIQSMTINGKTWDKTYLPHDAIMNGSHINFIMANKPSKWGTSKESRPYSITKIK